MSIVRNQIEKPYLILCEGKDALNFIICYLNSEALAKDQRFANDIQVFDFGGINDLRPFLMTLKNMDKFEQVTSLAIIRDAERDYDKACRDVSGSIEKCGWVSPERCGTWIRDNSGLNIGYTLFPLTNQDGTLEDLCIRILSEKESKSILSDISLFLSMLESSYGRNYHRKHKNVLNTYLASSDEYVTMPLGLAAKSGAFNWETEELEPLESFLTEGFITVD